MNPREQKNALRKILHHLYGNNIDIENTREGISSSNTLDYPDDYKKIINNLSKYRGNKKFNNNFRQPEFDFIILNKRIIIEYDERQHFSKARAISLNNYPRDIKTFFNKSKWIKRCTIINAKDNDPKDRDERRAFYDSVRDIEAYRNGWYLIRFYDGEQDWTAKDAWKYLKLKIELATKKNIRATRSKARIIRLALKSECNPFNNDNSLTESFNHLVKDIGEDIDYDYLVTPGGFLHFKWPNKYKHAIKEQKESQKIIPILKKLAEHKIEMFWKGLPNKTKTKLQSNIKFITFGIDANNCDDGDYIQRIQFVALFSVAKSKIIHWTGKSYPTTDEQKQGLIEFENLKTHFIKVNNERICLLGCHDLKMVSPRAKAIAGIARQKKIRMFDRLMRQLKPNLILHHPHNTDTYKIWNTEWKAVEKYYPFVKEYASGIRYYNNGHKKREKLELVLEKTKHGKVRTIKY